MGLIEVIMTVCLSQAAACEEKHLQFIDQGGSLTQCMMKAPIYMAAWSAEHPGRNIVKWRCAYPGQQDQSL